MSTTMKEFLATVQDSNRYLCPLCSGTRKKKSDRTLSVELKPDAVVYNCWHCNEQGGFSYKQLNASSVPLRSASPRPTAISVPKNIDEKMIENFLAARGISYEQVKNKFQVTSGTRFFREKGDLSAGEELAVGFVYGKDEAIKWRPINDKRFIQDGAARTLWGIEKIRAKLELPKTIVLVEGELDCLSIASVMDIDVVSVPNGAPSKISDRKPAKDDKKFEYLWDARQVLSNCDQIILATDHDEAGEALKEEIARRVGRAKCYQIDYPQMCKDPNDILMVSGAEELKKIIESASPLPLDGVFTAESYEEKVKHLYDNGMYEGASTGIVSVDELFTVALGQLTVVTGVPGSGKSEFIDQLMVNLAEREGWKFAVASFENPPDLHICKLGEKRSKKSIFDERNKMSKQELEESLRFVDDHFLFLEQKGGDLTTIDNILDRLAQACLRGIKGVVIDPYNYIVQDAGSDDNEHQFINQLLTKLCSFAKAYQIHIWMVAHPAKMQTNTDGFTAVPKGMNISGSAAWFAKADLGVTVHRVGDISEIHVWKCRFKWIGQVGMTRLKYDRQTGLYSERNEVDYKSFKSINNARRDYDDVPF